MITNADILLLGQSDILIGTILSMWNHGDITWEQALLYIIKAQHESRKRLEAEIVKIRQNEVNSNFIVKR